MKDRVRRAANLLREYCKSSYYRCSECGFHDVNRGCCLYGYPHTWRKQAVKEQNKVTWCSECSYREICATQRIPEGGLCNKSFFAMQEGKINAT